MNTDATAIAEAVARLHAIRKSLCEKFPRWKFTLDGRLVGDIGEAHAYSNYALEHLSGNGATHDFKCADGRKVQVKITQGNNLGLGLSVPCFEYLLAFHLSADGKITEVYNGRGARVYQRDGKKPIHSISVARLILLQKDVDDAERIPKRA